MKPQRKCKEFLRCIDIVVRRAPKTDKVDLFRYPTKPRLYLWSLCILLCKIWISPLKLYPLPYNKSSRPTKKECYPMGSVPWFSISEFSAYKHLRTSVSLTQSYFLEECIQSFVALLRGEDFNHIPFFIQSEKPSKQRIYI